MGMFFDMEQRKKEAKATDAAIEMLLDIVGSSSERKSKEVRLLRLGKQYGSKISDESFKVASNENLTDEQVESVTNYLEMAMAGLETFMEQFNNTVEKENPHNSGN